MALLFSLLDSYSEYSNWYDGKPYSAIYEVKDVVTESFSIPVTKDQFDQIFGATIRLEYEHYNPTQDKEDFSQGCLLVTFEAQGKSFSAEEDSVFLKD